MSTNKGALVVVVVVVVVAYQALRDLIRNVKIS